MEKVTLIDVYKRVWYRFLGIPLFYKLELIGTVPEKKLKAFIKARKQNKKKVISR